MGLGNRGVGVCERIHPSERLRALTCWHTTTLFTLGYPPPPSVAFCAGHELPGPEPMASVSTTGSCHLSVAATVRFSRSSHHVGSGALLRKDAHGTPYESPAVAWWGWVGGTRGGGG